MLLRNVIRRFSYVSQPTGRHILEHRNPLILNSIKGRSEELSARRSTKRKLKRQRNEENVQYRERVRKTVGGRKESLLRDGKRG
jgi:hypothetical protein